jgi:DNA topoisomerase-1
LLATGRDAKNRKQYLYHPLWREVRDETKFHRMREFGRALPKIREQADRDLRQHGLPKSRVIAAMIQLLDGTALRIGNEQYARTNGSFGLTTLSDTHLEASASSVQLTFVGKGGKQQSVSLRSPRVARVVAQCCELPGQQLFAYRDADGTVHEIHSDDVNGYLKEAAGGQFTAKDFRTWRGSVVAALQLAEAPPPQTRQNRRQAINSALDEVADALGNTPAICRKCYVHPHVIEAFESGELREMWVRNKRSWTKSGAHAAERLFGCLLKRQFARLQQH